MDGSPAKVQAKERTSGVASLSGRESAGFNRAENGEAKSGKDIKRRKNVHIKKRTRSNKRGQKRILLDYAVFWNICTACTWGLEVVFNKPDSSICDIRYILACIPVFLQQNILKRTAGKRLRYPIGGEK